MTAEPFEVIFGFNVFFVTIIIILFFFFYFEGPHVRLTRTLIGGSCLFASVLEKSQGKAEQLFLLYLK